MTTSDVAARVSALLDEGLDESAIAARLGISVHRVERVLDALTVTTAETAAPPAPAGPAEVKAARKLSPPTPSPVCGKPHGYKAHRNRGEEPCEECRQAWRTYQRDYAARRKAAARPRRRSTPAKPAQPAGRLVIRRKPRIGWTVSCPEHPRGYVCVTTSQPLAVQAADRHLATHGAGSAR